MYSTAARSCPSWLIDGSLLHLLVLLHHSKNDNEHDDEDEDDDDGDDEDDDVDAAGYWGGEGGGLKDVYNSLYLGGVEGLVGIIQLTSWADD